MWYIERCPLKVPIAKVNKSSCKVDGLMEISEYTFIVIAQNQGLELDNLVRLQYQLWPMNYMVGFIYHWR